jgi:hypothetical protein
MRRGIASNFNVDMSFNPTEIASMLKEYEADHNTGIDISDISNKIYDYTSGYPFFVSRICKCIDEEFGKDWTIEGVETAIKRILAENNEVFDTINKILENNKDIYNLVIKLLVPDNFVLFSYGVPEIDLADSIGIIKRKGNGSSRTIISNKIFEMFLRNYAVPIKLSKT